MPKSLVGSEAEPALQLNQPLLDAMVGSEADPRSALARVYRRENRERVLEIERRYRARNREKLSEATAEYRRTHFEQYTKWRKQYEIKNREKIRAKHKAWCRAHRSKRNEQQRRSDLKHKDKWLERTRNYRAKNAEKIRAFSKSYRPKWRAKQRADNPQYLIKDRMRSALLRAIRKMGFVKSKRTEELIGCSMAALKLHIENQFLAGMGWHNPKSFVVDHIVPIVAFNLQDEEEAHCAFNWRNLRPITQIENAHKSSTIPNPLPSWLPPHIASRIESRRSS